MARRRRRADPLRRRLELLGRARRVAGVELAVDLGRGQLGVERDDDQRRLVARQLLDVLAGAGHQRPLGVDHHRHVGAERASAGRAGSRSRRPATASRSAAAASLEPPAMPGGDRDPLGDRELAGPVISQSVAKRNSSSARNARFGPSTPGQITSSKSAGSSETSSARSVGWTTETSGCRPSARGRAHQQAEVDLAGRERGQGHRRSHRARHCAGESDSARASAGWPSASRASRVRSRMRLVGAGRERERAGERLAAVGEALLHERPQALGRRRAVALEADQHRVDVRDRREDAARDLADDAHVAGELGEHRRHTVGGRAGRARRSAPPPPSAPSRPTGRRSRARSS